MGKEINKNKVSKTTSKKITKTETTKKIENNKSKEKNIQKQNTNKKNNNQTKENNSNKSNVKKNQSNNIKKQEKETKIKKNDNEIKENNIPKKIKQEEIQVKEISTKDNKILKIKKKKRYKKIIAIITLLVLLISLFIILNNINKKQQKEEELKRQEELYIEKLKNIRDHYNQYMITNKETFLYNDKYEKVGEISKNIYLVLDELNDHYKEGYYKLKNYDMYIKYDVLDTSEKQEYDKRYKNYIPFNKSIITNENTKLYTNEEEYYVLNYELQLPIIIDDFDKYYVEFDEKLVYVLKENTTVVDNNINTEKANAVPILNYHFVISKEAGEDKLCSPSSICHTDTQFDSHMKYIKENNFYTITMQELEMFIDKKINLPKKSVSITIDDGWFVGRAIQILEKYDVMGTLFLIGYLAPVSDYASKNLEVHSHTWNLHNISNCQEGRSPLLCYDKNTLVEDLKKSRESLNNTTYFCYPFYEYNNHAINALKEAGFTMALTGGNYKAKQGIDKFKIPRYVVYNTTSVNELANKIN